MRRFVLILALLVAVVICDAQQTSGPRVTLELKDAGLAELVKSVESQSSYHFYYDEKQFDSVRINASVKNEFLSRVLSRIFNQTTYHYAILDDSKAILLTKGHAIVTELPRGFFGDGSKDSSDALAGVQDFSEKKAAKIDASIENKLFIIGIKTDNPGPGKAILAGYIRDVKSSEPIVGAAINIEGTSINTGTDQYGFYSLNLPKGRHVLNIQGMGMKDTKRQLMLYNDGKFDIQMEERVTSLKEVIVSAQKTMNVSSLQMGMERLNIKTIKKVPTVFGEADILKVVTTLPGVKTTGEAGTGFNVRGGSTDQNLILFNDATIYNPSHFFGFFSTFNPDVVQDVELYKSSIPAKYGGRLSSVLDITSREGNKKKFSGTAGVGLLTSRLSLEGPIKKDKTSFILGGRTTYANWLLGLLPDEYKNSKASFYDINLNITHQFNAKNSLYFTGYISRDKFNLNSDTVYGYGNTNVSLKWKHSFSNKFQSFVTVGYDKYDYNITSTKDKLNAFKLGFDINQYNFKTDFNYYLNQDHTISFGVSSIRYHLHPGYYRPISESLLVGDTIRTEKAQESAIYLSERWNISPDFSLEGGIRYSFYNYLGPNSISRYAQGLPKSEANLVGTDDYKLGSVINNYHGPEYRLGARYIIAPALSLKAGYNSQRQYIHMLSNTAIISPTDIWKLSDPNIKPQRGDQFSFGIYKNWKANTIETSLEVYYKRIYDYLDYKSGARLIMNQTIERDVINTKGKAYGLEVMIKKQTGKLNGWISYTYSRVLLRMDDPTSGEIINGGNFYPANYDKPHDITFIGNYRFTHRFSFSLNSTYSTGRPITVPIGRYYYSGSQRALYADRNAFRIPDYFRTDFSMNLDGNHKLKQKFHNSWTFGFYNLTGRKNPYSVYFVSQNGSINGYKLSIFGSIIPFVNYNVRF